MAIPQRSQPTVPRQTRWRRQIPFPLHPQKYRRHFSEHCSMGQWRVTNQSWDSCKTRKRIPSWFWSKVWCCSGRTGQPQFQARRGWILCRYQRTRWTPNQRWRRRRCQWRKCCSSRCSLRTNHCDWRRQNQTWPKMYSFGQVDQRKQLALFERCWEHPQIRQNYQSKKLLCL